MKLRLFLDEDVHAGLASALRKRGYDAIHAVEAERLGVSDQEQLTFAATDRRCLVTFNVGDFVQLHRRWTEKGQGHAGIVMSKQLTIGESLRRLLVLLQKEDTESMTGEIRFL